MCPWMKHVREMSSSWFFLQPTMATQLSLRPRGSWQSRGTDTRRLWPRPARTLPGENRLSGAHCSVTLVKSLRGIKPKLQPWKSRKTGDRLHANGLWNYKTLVSQSNKKANRSWEPVWEKVVSIVMRFCHPHFLSPIVTGNWPLHHFMSPWFYILDHHHFKNTSLLILDNF